MKRLTRIKPYIIVESMIIIALSVYIFHGAEQYSSYFMEIPQKVPLAIVSFAMSIVIVRGITYIIDCIRSTMNK